VLEYGSGIDRRLVADHASQVAAICAAAEREYVGLDSTLPGSEEIAAGLCDHFAVRASLDKGVMAVYAFRRRRLVLDLSRLVSLEKFCGQDVTELSWV